MQALGIAGLARRAAINGATAGALRFWTTWGVTLRARLISTKSAVSKSLSAPTVRRRRGMARPLRSSIITAKSRSARPSACVAIASTIRPARFSIPHASKTDPDARLYKKSRGAEARLAYLGHVDDPAADGRSAEAT